MAAAALDWTDRRVVVTGGNGFIGARLMRLLLDQGAQATSWDIASGSSAVWALPAKNRMHVDVADLAQVRQAMRRCRPDIVLHLAAQSQVGAAFSNPLPTLRSNLEGTWNVLDACRLADLPIVVASSDKAYGVSPRLPYDEQDPLRASYIYDTSKSCTDLLTQSYAMTYGMATLVSRCGNVYGPGDLHWQRIVPHVVRSALEGVAPVLRSDGRPRRDYVFLDDAVDAYLRLASAGLRSNGPRGAFNFGTGKPVTVMQVVRKVLQAAGMPHLKAVKGPPAVGEIPHQFLTNDRARKELGWAPRTELGPGLAATVQWYRQQLSRKHRRTPARARR